MAFDHPFLRIFSDYSAAAESFALLAWKLERFIFIAFFCQGHVIIPDRKTFYAILFALSLFSICLHVTHGVQRDLIKISLQPVLICRAESSVFVNLVTVL